MSWTLEQPVCNPLRPGRLHLLVWGDHPSFSNSNGTITAARKCRSLWRVNWRVIMTLTDGAFPTGLASCWRLGVISLMEVLLSP